MPFTFAHPAIILPFVYASRKWISMTALIIGSVMPDAESYLRMYSEKDITHSWPGFFLFGLPFGILLTFVFHNIVRNPLINNLPDFLYQRFSRFTNFNWNRRFLKNWLVVILSLVIGGVSHYVWDSFSNFDGWFVTAFPNLKGNVSMFGGKLEIAYLIQYITTLLGMIIILVFIAAMPRSTDNKPPGHSGTFWMWVAITATVLFLGRTAFLQRSTIDDKLIGITSAFIYGLVLVAFVFPKKKSTQLSS